MLVKDKKIAIIGGGPGGLTLAKLLQLKGASVKVYERDYDKDVRVQGATLDLHEESGLEALKRAGLLDAFMANYRPGAGNLRLIDKDGNIKFDSHEIENQEELRPEIDRGPLRNILLESLNKETVVWNSQYSAMERLDDGWILHFKNGTSANADIVIAADGANSKIRSLITDIKPIYSGITIVEGNVYNAKKNAPRLNALLKGGKIFAFGEDKSLILSSKGDGSLSFYTGCKVDEFWAKNSGINFSNKEEVFQWFKQEFGTWNEIWQEIFYGDEISFIPRPQYHFPLNQSWNTLPNLTMLGDAAHRMPPYAGEGANMAMQDAFELSDCLARNNFPDLKKAISHYEKQMLERVSEITKITLESTEMMHSGDPINSLIEMFGDFGRS